MLFRSRKLTILANIPANDAVARVGRAAIIGGMVIASDPAARAATVLFQFPDSLSLCSGRRIAGRVRGEMSTSKIFISYGRHDAAEFAIRLAAWLSAEGFEPWLDVQNGIPIGAPFDIRIELGISGSDLVIALLSPWSVRPDGFCRNELLFAQAKRKPIIPVRLAEVCPPIQIISLNYIDSAADPETAFLQLRPAIEKAVRSGMSDLKDWSGTSGGNAWWSTRTPLDFSEELAAYGGSFYGRDWLFDEMRARLAHGGTHLLLIQGVPGVGKSALAAQMTTWPAVRGIHFCSRSNVDSCRPATWIRTVVYQLAAQIPEYRRKIEALSPPNSEDPSTMFRALIADPWRSLGSKPAPESSWLFVIDALDESAMAAGTDFADFLASSVERFPEWFRLVVTTLPSADIMARFRLPGMETMALDSQDSRNRKDLRDYLAARLHGTVVEGREKWILPRLSDLAGGNFLFAKLALDSLLAADLEHRLTIDELGRLPPGLGGLYFAMFSKRFPDPAAYEREVLPLLDCLIAAPEGIPRDFLAGAAGPDRRALLRGILKLSPFLQSRGNGESLFHASVIEWLSNPGDSAEFAAMSESGHKHLAEACWGEFLRQPPAMSEYAVRNAATHLRHAGRLADLFTLFEDDRFLQQLLRLGGPSTLRRELLEGLAAAESAGSIEEIGKGHPWSIAVARGLAGSRDAPVEEVKEYFETATSAKSRVVAGLAWLELGWFHKDRDTSPGRSAVLENARRALDEAVRTLSGLGFESLLAEAQRSLGWMLKDSGHPDDAEKAFLGALSLYEGLAATLQVAWTERDLGVFYRDGARWEESKGALDRAQALFREYDDGLNLAITLKDMGTLQLLLALRRPAERRALLTAADGAFTEARDLAATTSSHDLDAWLLRYEGISWAAAGRVQAGREAIERALPLFQEFIAANEVLCRLCVDRITEIRQPHLLELFGREPVPRANYEELFRQEED